MLTINDHGLLITFRLFYKDFLNVTQKSEWFITDGYKSNNEVVYPRRALYAGATSGLEVMLYTRDEDLNYICGDSLQGYKVFFFIKPFVFRS